MALAQRYINKAAVIAALFMKDKIHEELLVMDKQLGTEESRVRFSKDLQKELSPMLKVLSEQDQAAFCDDVTARLYSSIQTKLAQQ